MNVKVTTEVILWYFSALCFILFLFQASEHVNREHSSKSGSGANTARITAIVGLVSAALAILLTIKF